MTDFFLNKDKAIRQAKKDAKGGYETFVIATMDEYGYKAGFQVVMHDEPILQTINPKKIVWSSIEGYLENKNHKREPYKPLFEKIENFVFIEIESKIIKELINILKKNRIVFEKSFDEYGLSYVKVNRKDGINLALKHDLPIKVLDNYLQPVNLSKYLLSKKY
jgi:hypothetical protein